MDVDDVIRLFTLKKGELAEQNPPDAISGGKERTKGQK
jgi:hypothetical protein